MRRWSVRLDGVATIERARKGKIYPKGVTLVQLSASKGQVVKHPGGEVDSRYAVVEALPEGPITSKFLFCYLNQSMPSYADQMITGINIQVDALRSYPVTLPIPFKPKERK